MNTKFFKLFTTSLFLALMIASLFFVSGTSPAHAASTHFHEQSVPAHTLFGCNPGGAVPVPAQLIAVAIEGTVTHVTACGVQLLTAGIAPIALLGTAGAIVATVSISVIQAAAAFSCDGGVYVYTSNLAIPPSTFVVPDC